MRRARDFTLGELKTFLRGVTTCLCHTLSKRSYNIFINIYATPPFFIRSFIKKNSRKPKEYYQIDKKKSHQLLLLLYKKKRKKKLERILNTRGINDQCM